MSENELYDIDLFGRVSGLHLLAVSLSSWGVPENIGNEISVTRVGWRPALCLRKCTNAVSDSMDKFMGWVCVFVRIVVL